MKVIFTPSTTGALNGNLLIPSNATAGNINVSLSGEGVAPASPLASVSATALSFGSITVGSASTEQAFTVKNTGNADLIIGAVTLTGTDFVITNNGCTGITLASATNCIIKAKFTPSAALARAASISIPSNDPVSPNISVALDGTGLSAPKPAISATPGNINFAKVSAAGSATQTVTVTNKGAANLNIAALTLGGADSANFGFGSDTCSSTAVAVAATCTFDLTFTPVNAGSYGGVLSIPSDDPNTPVLKISLGGTTAALAAADVAAAGGVTVKDLVVVDGLSGVGESYSIDKALSFTATGVTGSATFTVTFDSLPANSVIYKVVGSVWKQLYPVNTCAGASGIALDTALRTLTFTLADNSDCDSDLTVGTIKDPIALVSPATYSLSYTAGAGGSLTGTTAQTVTSGSNGSAVSAVPAANYHFVNWSDASTANPRTDNPVTANVTVTANFAINTYTLSYSAGANGTLTGTASQTVNYNASGSAVTAVPATGYNFVNWSDASTANPRTDNPVTANVTVSASYVFIDTIPDAFSFTAQTGAALGSVATSNTITVAGINSPSAITIAGGTYSIPPSIGK